MATEVLLPKLGLTMETGAIEEWLVDAGTLVAPGEPLMRISTDKVDVDVEAEAGGVFRPIVDIGLDLAPGTLIGWLLEDGEDVPTGSPTAAAPSAAPAAESTAAPAAVAAPTQRRSGRVFASPNARRVASEHGVDVAMLTGTGPNGRVITADVVDAIAAGVNGTPTAVQPSVGSPLVRRDAAVAGVDLGAVAPSGPGGRVLRSDVAAARTQAPVSGAPSVAAEIIPLTGMRGVIAARMHASLQEMAQLTLGTDATMDGLVALRAQLKQQWAERLPVPTITDLIVRAAALALVDHPRLNATVQDNAVHVQPDINIGVAVALDDGLIVPVIQGADRRPVSEIAADSRRLANAARTNSLTLADLEGGSFTVSTLGSYGIDFFTPVITPGQVAILGVGRLRDSVRWDGETPVRTQILTLSLTFDHRAVDGAPAADYLRSVVSRLEHPLTLLA